jgi:2-iminobutanoate/2-iminopropanoate deaminase
MRPISTDQAPGPRGHYSQAIVHNGLVFTAGQLPIDPATGAVVGESIEEQTEQVLENVAAVLSAAGATLESVIKVTVYVPDMTLWSGLNEVYSKFFGDHKPARCVVPTRALHQDVKIEVDVVAAVG